LRCNETTLQPDVCVDGLPESLNDVHAVLCDAMLATGGSLVCVLDVLRSRGATGVTVLCLVAAQPGVDFVFSRHPGLANIVAELNAVGFIMPGLGEAGDRLLGPLAP
jgi:uracil phosphoribosyltransferase